MMGGLGFRAGLDTRSCPCRESKIVPSARGLFGIHS